MSKINLSSASRLKQLLLDKLDDQIRYHSGLKVLPEDPMEKMSIGFFVMTCIVVSVLTAFFGLAYAANGFYKMLVPQWAIALVAQICLYIYRKNKSIVLAGNIMLLVIFLASWYRVQNFGGIQAPTFYTYTLIPVFSISFMPFAWALFWTCAFVGLALVYHFLHRFGMGPVFTMSDTEASTIRIWGIFFANFSSLIWLYFFKKMTADYQKKLKELSQSRATLLRILSHDIANPLMVMDINIHKLQQQYTPEIVSKISRGSNMILEIVNGVREIEALLSGKREFNKNEISIQNLAQELGFLFEAVMEKKQQTLQINIQPKCISKSLYVDRSILLHQILANILSNASKFSPRNAVIRVEIFEDNSQIVLEIIDQGIGIPPHILAGIFAFDTPTTRKGTENEMGTGFGMPIAKLCTEYMGGKMEIFSDTSEKLGTTVKLIFAC